MSAVARLKRERPRSLYLRVSAVALAGLAVAAWASGTFEVGDLFTERRAENLRRFLTVDAVPREVRDAEPGGGLAAFWGWLAPRLSGRNLEAAGSTLALAVVAATLAAAIGLALAPLTARRAGLGRAGQFVGRAARLACVLARAVPEYVLAFLFGALVPSPAWACVLALALHNGGILGRLYGETVENLDPRPARAWRGLGARPGVTFALAEVPTALPRLLTYFFYRFETCVRESTVLGMLGFVSLGHWIVQERAAGRYDEVLVLVGLGAAIVLAADLVSWALRTLVRRAT